VADICGVGNADARPGLLPTDSQLLQVLETVGQEIVENQSVEARPPVQPPTPLRQRKEQDLIIQEELGILKDFQPHLLPMRGLVQNHYLVHKVCSAGAQEFHLETVDALPEGLPQPWTRP